MAQVDDNPLIDDAMSPSPDPIAYALDQAAVAEPLPVDPGLIRPNFFPGYSIVREIHRGGQGVVYEATKRHPARRVAIKALRDGFLAGPLDRERFRREVQFLTRLKHPNVVEVFEAGETESHPYFVMEFVEGEPLDDFMSRRRTGMAISEVLALFSSLCEGITAAHLRGIVHRDLKPRNILVDSTGRPRVLDFGLSRMADHVSTNSQPSLTLTGQFVGSLHWASPEQAEGDSDRIDVRTDVYALGLILFHMLTGRFPYDMTGSMRQVLDTIRNEEPQRPSSFRRDIEEDLDRIVLRALAKEPERRYQSVRDLSRDIASHLRREPIEARRDSTWYVLRKVIRRHRAVATGLAAMLAFALVYTVSVTVLLRRAREAETQALQSADQAREFFSSAHSTATLAVQTIAEKIKDIPGARQIRRELLEASYAEYEKLFAHETNDPVLLSDLTHAKVMLSDLALNVGDLALARKLRTEALVVREAQAAAAPPGDWKKHADLSIGLVLVGDLDKSESHWESAKKYYERAWEIDEELHQKHPDVRTLLDNLGWSYERLGYVAWVGGDVVHSRDFFEKQLEVGRELERRDPNDVGAKTLIAAAAMQMASVSNSAMDSEAHREWLDRSLEILQRLIDDQPENLRFQGMYAAVLCGTANSGLCPEGEACEELDRALDRCLTAGRPLLEAEPDNVFYRHALAGALRTKAQITGNRREFSRAYDLHQQARAIHEVLLAVQPESAGRMAELMHDHSNLAEIARLMGDETVREGHFQEMRKLYVRFAPRGMDESQHHGVFQMLCIEAMQPAGLCDPALAVESARRHLGTGTGAGMPSRYYDVAVALRQSGEWAEAIEFAEKGLSMILPGDSPLRKLLVEVRDDCTERLRAWSESSAKNIGRDFQP